MKMCSKVDQTATLSPQDNYFPEVLENCKEICYNVENAKAKWRKPDEEVRIMAVTKTVPPEKVNFAVAQGFKLLGDSLKLAHEISRLAVKNNKTMNVLVEINIGDEATKSGVSAEMAEELVRQTAQLPNVSVKGLMAIPPVGSGEDVFEKMHGIFLSVKEKDIQNVSMDILSMGMSGDYELAIKHGSNLVRIGTKLFGARKYLED